jgi:GNAT superfamily N-acetyltransferase
MAVEFRLDTRISDEEYQQLFCWDIDIYGDDLYQLQWRPRHWRLYVYANRQLVSHVGMVRHTVLVGGHAVVVGGIGQVVTVPAAQRRGYACRALEKAARFLRDELQVEFGLLFCLERMLPFYARLGWQTIDGPVWIEQPGKKIICPLPVMVLPFQHRIWPTGTVDLCSLPW